MRLGENPKPANFDQIVAYFKDMKNGRHELYDESITQFKAALGPEQAAGHIVGHIVYRGWEDDDYRDLLEALGENID